jgi:hypothetical protein
LLVIGFFGFGGEALSYYGRIARALGFSALLRINSRKTSSAGQSKPLGTTSPGVRPFDDKEMADLGKRCSADSMEPPFTFFGPNGKFIGQETPRVGVRVFREEAVV